MKTTYLFPLGLALVLIILGGVWAFKSQKTATTYPTPLQTQTATTTTTAQTTPAATTQKPGTYTMTEVATHTGMSSCWTAISGSVYDLTAWIAEHPGGEGAILSICGKDGTTAFMGQHGGQGRPEAILASFKIGTLGS